MKKLRECENDTLLVALLLVTVLLLLRLRPTSTSF